MATLWTFGDSMTFGHGCVLKGPGDAYYKQYKKNDDDLIWPVILANKLGYELNNLGKCGVSNDYIFDTVIDNYHLILENDIVIINKTFSHRFDIPRFDVPNDSTDVFYSICGEVDKSNMGRLIPENNKEEYETIINFSYYFSGHISYHKRQEKRYDFLKSIIKCYKYFEFYTESVGRLVNLQTIREASNGKIKDNHLSFAGHKQFANYIYASLFDIPIKPRVKLL